MGKIERAISLGFHIPVCYVEQELVQLCHEHSAFCEDRNNFDIPKPSWERLPSQYFRWHCIHMEIIVHWCHYGIFLDKVLPDGTQTHQEENWSEGLPKTYHKDQWATDRETVIRWAPEEQPFVLAQQIQRKQKEQNALRHRSANAQV